MAELNYYRQCIEKVLTNYSEFLNNSNTPLETELIFDREHDHYQVIHIGWDKGQYIFSPVLHFDIKQNHVWFQYNATEFEIVDELLAMGISKSEIVIGFHSANKRKLTEYCAA
jgi:hypothetical protein